MSEINNKKCAQQMLDTMEHCNFEKVKNLNSGSWIKPEDLEMFSNLSGEKLNYILTEYLISRNWRLLKDEYWIDYTTNCLVPVTQSTAVAIQKIRDKINHFPWYKKLFLRI